MAVGNMAVGVRGTGVAVGVAGLHPLNTIANPIAALSTNRVNCFAFISHLRYRLRVERRGIEPLIHFGTASRVRSSELWGRATNY